MTPMEVMSFFNKTARIGVLSTADADGKVNAAVFGSPRMIDENTVVMGIGENRTYKNLLDNPKAVFIIVEPGQSLMEWKGLRVYLKVEAIDTDGLFYNEIKTGIAEVVGKEAARMIQAAVRFKITEVRNLIAPP
jgi:hypothetical protein